MYLFIHINLLFRKIKVTFYQFEQFKLNLFLAFPFPCIVIERLID